MIKKKIKMDLSISNALQVVYAVQGDTNTRNVVIDLYNAGSAWIVPDGTSGVVKFQKADGKGGIYDKLPNGFPAVVYEENSNQIEVSLAPHVLTFPGEVKAQVSLIYDNNIISTFSFVVLVQEDPSANAEKSTDYVNWDRYFIPQTSGASVGQYLKIAKVDDLGRVIEVSPIDAPSGSGAIDGELDMKSNSILNVGTVEFWNDDELATVIMQSEFPEGDNESENFNGVIEFRTSRGDEPVVIRNVAKAKSPNEAVNKQQLDEALALVGSPLIGATAEITPSDVVEAVEAGRNVVLVHADKMMGLFTFNSFTFAEEFDTIYSTNVVNLGTITMLVGLYGTISSDNWVFNTKKIINENDAVKNPYALTIGNAVYDGSDPVSIPASYSKTEIDAIMGAYINDIDALIGGDSLW